MWQHAALGTYALVAALAAAWLIVQRGGVDASAFASSVCDFGLVPGEVTGRAPLGTRAPLGGGQFCAVDARSINFLTPATAMFLHSDWWHLLGNALVLWIFGRTVERRMGSPRFLGFYLLCGLAAGGAHILADGGSSAPTVGASGAIAGVLGAYLVLYARAVPLHGWLVLACWLAWQLASGLPQLLGSPAVIGGSAAVWAHIGGLLMGFLLAKPFEDSRRLSPPAVDAPPVQVDSL
jgi:membrane associated rhomboid family serine protease